jgi:peptidoglycan/LPS O-acetylase OafA/YrhL
MSTGHRRLADILRPEHNNFGAIRLAMALAVLLSHSFWLATGQPSAEPLHAWTHHSLGEHAVQVFFFLSGVVVAQSLLKSGSVIDFATARILRIFPALIACVLLTAFVLGPFVSTLPFASYLRDGALPLYLAKTLSLSTGSAPLPGTFPGTPVPQLVNLSLWTLKYEALCYTLLAAFGFLYIRLPSYRAILTAALAVLVALVFVGTPKPLETYTAADNLRYFVLFFATGTLAYLLRERLVLTWLALPPLFAVFALAIGTRFAELSTALFLGYATLLVATLPIPALRRFTNKEDYSYAIYIIGCPVQQALVQAVPGIDPLTLTLVSLGFVAPLAMLSWTLIERPAMARRHAVASWIKSHLAAARRNIPHQGADPQGQTP